MRYGYDTSGVAGCGRLGLSCAVVSLVSDSIVVGLSAIGSGKISQTESGGGVCTIGKTSEFRLGLYDRIRSSGMVKAINGGRLFWNEESIGPLFSIEVFLK